MLADCIRKDPEAHRDGLLRQVAAELTSLRKLRKRHEYLSRVHQELSVEYGKVKNTSANWGRQCQSRSMHVIEKVS
jgi:hypothetical protein